MNKNKYRVFYGGVFITDIECFTLESAIEEAKKKYYSGDLDNIGSIKMEIFSEQSRNRQWPRPMEWYGVMLL